MPTSQTFLNIHNLPLAIHFSFSNTTTFTKLATLDKTGRAVGLVLTDIAMADVIAYLK